MNLGEKLKAARESAGMTQIELADILGTNQISISRWENNNRTPNIVTFGEICRAVGASADKILEINL